MRLNVISQLMMGYMVALSRVGVLLSIGSSMICYIGYAESMFCVIFTASMMLVMVKCRFIG